MSQISVSFQQAQVCKDKPDFFQLGFGRYFTDHMFLSNFNRNDRWHNNRVEKYQNLSLDPGASVLHYGQALFEGLKAFKQTNGRTVIFRPEFNWQRMKDGAARLCMEAPPKEVFIEGLKRVVKADDSWIPTQSGASLYIRPTLVGTEAFLGVRPSDEYLFYIILSPVGSYYGEGTDRVKIWIEENFTRATVGGLGATKAAANYAASLKAAFDAKKKGYAQVLWLDASKNFVEEVGTMNVFFVFENEIITPTLDGTILSGGTREVVIQLLKEKEKKGGRKIIERKLTITEVVDGIKTGKLTEAFGTGTAAVISPIGEFANTKVTCELNGPTTLANELMHEIVSIQRGEAPDRFNWLLPI